MIFKALTSGLCFSVGTVYVIDAYDKWHRDKAAGALKTRMGIRLGIAFLFYTIASLHGEVFQLDTETTNSVDTITVGATFKGGNETNTMTVITGNRVIQIEIRATQFPSTDGEHDKIVGGMAVRQTKPDMPSPSNLTNDTPVRAWNGALTNPTDKDSLTVQPVPPMPPSTNSVACVTHRAWRENSPPPIPPPFPTVERGKINQVHRDRMMKYFRDGGQKGRVAGALQPNP